MKIFLFFRILSNFWIKVLYWSPKTTLAKSTAAGELTPTVTPQYVLTLESAFYKNVTGDRKGYINIIGATTDVEVAVIRIP